MFQGYKIVSVTPAGRKRYLKILDFYLRKNKNIIDKHIFWVNTKNMEDIDYMKYLAQKYPDFYELEYIDDKIVLQNEITNYNSLNIHSFFKNCIDDKTIYIRFDDDICYIHDDAIENLLKFRIDNPNFFIVYPLIINNCFITNILQQKNISSNKFGVAGEDRMAQGWSNPKIGENLHYEFLNNFKNKNLNIYKIENLILDNYNSVSINCICWFGNEFSKFGGNVGRDEELWLSQSKPYDSFKFNAICGSSLVVHFSFFTQREYFERETSILEQYENIAFESLSQTNNFSMIKNDFKYDNLFKNFLAEKIISDQKIEFDFYTKQKDKINLLDCTCVISIKIDSQERYENLKFTLNHLTKYFDMNILIVEIDTESKINLEKFEDNSNIKHIIISNTINSRNKILNSIYENIDTEIIMNYEVDFIIYPLAILEAVNKIRNHEFNFAIPYDGKVLFYNKNTSEKIKKTNFIPDFSNHIYEFEEQMELKLNLILPIKLGYHYGLCWIFNKKTYKKIGYDNPNMFGNGFEDFERYIRTKKIGYDIYHSRIGVAYHLWHPRNSDFYEFYGKEANPNIQETKKIDALTIEELKLYIFTWSLNANILS